MSIENITIWVCSSCGKSSLNKELEKGIDIPNSALSCCSERDAKKYIVHDAYLIEKNLFLFIFYFFTNLPEEHI